LLFFCLDARAKDRLHLLQHRDKRFSMLHQRVLILPEILEKFGGPPPFHLRELPIQPYPGEIGTLQLRSATLERGPLRYYRLVDTPHGCDCPAACLLLSGLLLCRQDHTTHLCGDEPTTTPPYPACASAGLPRTPEFFEV
jgi:hypothetical protein